MSYRLARQVGKSQRLAVLGVLKKNPAGLPVKPLAAQLKMSYMGVKDHCLELAKQGYLTTWRNARPVGRPEMFYRLTQKAQELFPQPNNAVTLQMLQSAAKLFGATAPGKLLLLYFQEQTKFYRDSIRGETLAERAKWLARVRDREGCFSVLESEPTLRLTEYHQPLQDLFEVYPEATRLEEAMMGRILGVEVKRNETVFTEGTKAVVFEIKS